MGTNDETKKKSIVNTAISFISASVSSMIPALIGGGMLKVLLLLLSYAIKDFAATDTYMVLGWVANAPFYFMPIFVAYGAAKHLGGTIIYSMACVAALLTPEFAAMVTNNTQLNLFGIPIRLVKYQQQILPALLIVILCYYVEKFLDKIVPKLLKPIFVGMGTMGITMIFGFTVLGPLGSYVGSAISGAFVWMDVHMGPVTVGVLAAVLPWLVLTGMHNALVPFMTQAIADPGYDSIFRPAFLLHNMAEGGACLGVALRAKKAEHRSEAFSIAFGAIVAGVSEPAIYGINLKLKKPMYAVMAGGGAGGVVSALLGAKAYNMGYSTLMALPIFEDTIVAMIIGVVVAIVVSAVVAFIIGFNEDDMDAKA